MIAFQGALGGLRFQNFPGSMDPDPPNKLTPSAFAIAPLIQRWLRGPAVPEFGWPPSEILQTFMASMWSAQARSSVGWNDLTPPLKNFLRMALDSRWLLNKNFELNKTLNFLGVFAPYPNSVPTSDCTLRPCCILLSTLRPLRPLSTPEFFCTTHPTPSKIWESVYDGDDSIQKLKHTMLYHIMYT